MTSYSLDPKLGYTVVETASGKKEYRKLCVRIKNKYYIKDVDCVEANDGKWYRKDSDLIVLDHETNKWILTSTPEYRKLIYGLVGFDRDGTPEQGYFTPNPYNNTYYVGFKGYGGMYTAINTDVLAENGCIEDLSTGKWTRKEELGLKQIKNYNEIANKINHQAKGYNIEDNVDEAVQKQKLYDEFEMPLSKDVRRYSRFLNDLTFGLEIECSHGYMPEHIQNRSGIVICRDGSLADDNGYPGPEFTTIPLTGAKGLQNIVNISNELKKRTKIDTKCSLHLHLGNLPTSRLFLVSLYVLCFRIQDEIFDMFPYYKQNCKVAGKKQEYCQKLKKMNMGILKDFTKEGYEKFINENYVKIFYWLSQNQNGSGYNPGQEWNRKMQDHPVSQKWNRKNRYYWVNLMNTMFSTRNTIEFRIHTPTVNSQKMINWLFITNAIVKYAILNSKEILTTNRKISLSEVLDYYKTVFKVPSAELLSDYLNAYAEERTKAFKADYNKQDYLSNWEIEGDKTYEFKYGNTTHLF